VPDSAAVIYFVDTSALVKAYVTERGSDTVQQAFARLDRAVAVSDTVLSETLGIIAKEYRKRLITRKQYSDGRDALLFDARERFYVVPTSPDVAAGGLRLMDTFRDSGVGGIDMLHLACADDLQQTFKEVTVGFMAADAALCRAAQDHGYDVFNPDHDSLDDLLLPELPLPPV
jgi:predicted nucleic acid-binding protein